MAADKTHQLEATAQAYGTQVIQGWEKLYRLKRRKLVEALTPFFLPGPALELGVADGEMTALLVPHFSSYTLVDGSPLHLDQTRERLAALGLPPVNSVLSLFEEFQPAVPFPNILATHILEHLDQPVRFLARAREWLAPGGRILLAVPNAQSLHRHIGAAMGMLDEVDALNEQDRVLGHVRVYTPDLLRQHITSAGLRVEHFGGLMVKPLSNRQIEAQWPDPLIEAFFAISPRFPELCSEIYVVAQA